MKFGFRTIHLEKRFALAISRGIHTGSDNLFVSVTCQNITGWGEICPGKSEGEDSAQSAQDRLENFLSNDLDPSVSRPLSVQQIHQCGVRHGLPRCVLAGLDIALWDWLGKKAGLPLYQLLGLGRPRTPTSLTIGINPPEIVRERIQLLLEDPTIRFLKIKLGSPEGIEADQAAFAQVLDSTRNVRIGLRVDANGGWNTNDALFMMKWLAERNTDYIEQPLPEGQEEDLPGLFRNRPLPVYVDESCRVSSDIKSWWQYVDGINLKLMKCGGITEALRIIAVARAYGLKTMIGCMSESSMSISAGAAICGLLDQVDLDSHLNLAPDPCSGAAWVDGVIMPNDLPGHGARINPQYHA